MDQFFLNFCNIFWIVPQTFSLISSKFSFSHDYDKIPLKTRQALLKIRLYSNSYKNFLRTPSTLFKASPEFLSKLPKIFSKTTFSLHFHKLYKFIQINRSCFRRLPKSHQIMKSFPKSPQKSKHKTPKSFL